MKRRGILIGAAATAALVLGEAAKGAGRAGAGQCGL